MVIRFGRDGYGWEHRYHDFVDGDREKQNILNVQRNIARHLLLSRRVIYRVLLFQLWLLPVLRAPEGRSDFENSFPA